MNVSSDDNDSGDSEDDDIDNQQQQRSLSFSSMKNEGDTNNNDTTDSPATTAGAADHDTDGKRGGLLLKEELIDREEEEEEDVAVAATNTSPTKNNTRIIVGGTSTRKIKPSYAILDGIQEEKNPQQQQLQQHRVTIALTTLPAMFGRSNEADKTNPNFFGLGKIKALSRKHCTIYYRDIDGGRMEYDTEQQRCIYKPPVDSKNKNTKNASLSLLKANPYHIQENQKNQNQKKKQALLLDPETHLPTTGFYVIENLGKNKMVVDLEMITKGESMVLRNGSAIR